MRTDVVEIKKGEQMKIEVDLDIDEIKEQISDKLIGNIKPLIREMALDYARKMVTKEIDKIDWNLYTKQIESAVVKDAIRQIESYHTFDIFFGRNFGYTKEEKDKREAFLHGCATAYAFMCDGCEIELQDIKDTVFKRVTDMLTDQIRHKVTVNEKNRKDIAEKIAEALLQDEG